MHDHETSDPQTYPTPESVAKPTHIGHTLRGQGITSPISYLRQDLITAMALNLWEFGNHHLAFPG
jgi:hypothetical protein